MQTLKLMFLGIALAISSLHAETTPEKALQRLVDGNKRFMKDASLHPNRIAERRQETAAKQEPFAIILGCSDSRVSPEILFDQGIGDLFIVRVAGNVAGPVELASIEYSVLVLHSYLIVVLGHENCGAVNAVVNGEAKGFEAIGSLIEPAVESSEGRPGNRLKNAIQENVSLTVERLRQDPLLKKRIDRGVLMVKGGYYNFHTGQVEFF